VPEVDFVALCDHVRGGEGGILHVIAAGIDRIRAAQLPTIQNVGLALRIALTLEECDTQHRIQVHLTDPEGQRLFEIAGTFGVTDVSNVPSGWPAFTAAALNFGMPIQQHGVHKLDLIIDDDLKKTIRVLVEPLPDRG